MYQVYEDADRPYILVRQVGGKVNRRYGALGPCARCGKEMWSSKHWGDNTYCSRKCGTTAGRRKKPATMRGADARFSKLVRAADGRCVRCGSTEFLQCAHIFSRRYRTIRWSRDNVVTLCRACHVYFTHRPLEWEDWITLRIGAEKWADLRSRAMQTTKVDYSTIMDFIDAQFR